MQDCKTLQELKNSVYDCSRNKFENFVEALEDKHKHHMKQYPSDKGEAPNGQIYWYVSLI